MFRRVPTLGLALAAISLFMLIKVCGCGGLFPDDGLGEYICDHLTDEEYEVLVAVQGMLDVIGIDYFLPCVIVVRDADYLGFHWPSLQIEGFPPPSDLEEGYDALIYNGEIYIKRFGSCESIDVFEEMLIKMILASNGYPQELWHEVKGE